MRLPFALLLLFSAQAHAFFLVSDPWPAGGLQPDVCTATEQPGPTTRDLTLEVTETGSKYIHADLSNATPGHHVWSIVCRSNTPGISPSPEVIFPFDVGVTPAPANLRLVP